MTNEYLYNVRIRCKKKSDPVEIRSKLTLAYLENEIMAPYHKGEHIVLNGRIIALNDIWSINIRRIPKPPSARKIWQRALHNFQYSVSESTFDDVGTDVTEEFIIGPPGRKVVALQKFGREVSSQVDNRDVFVVHGRNNAAREAMFTFLRSIGLNPLEWSEAVRATGKASPYVGEVLDVAFSKARAVVVLFTPDDEAILKEIFRVENEPEYEIVPTGQARPNVLFEAGMAMGRAEKSTVLVELGDVRPFSDVGGRHVIRLNNTIEVRRDLAQRLEAAGCPVTLEDTDWHLAGDFDAAITLLDNKQSGGRSPTNQGMPIEVADLRLSEDSIELLTEAANDHSGTIAIFRTFGGTTVQTNGKEFGEKRNARSEARWQQAVGILLTQGLIEDRAGKRELFFVTHSGYAIADKSRP